MTAKWERHSLKHWHMVKIHPHNPRRAAGLWDLAAIHTRQRPDAASGVRTSTCFPWLYNVAVCFHRGRLEDFAPRWMRQQQLKFKDWARTLPLSLQVQTNHQYSGRNYFFFNTEQFCVCMNIHSCCLRWVTSPKRKWNINKRYAVSIGTRLKRCFIYWGTTSAKGFKSETADQVNLSYLPERLHTVQAGLDGAVNARLFCTLNDFLDQQSAQWRAGKHSSLCSYRTTASIFFYSL